MPDAASVATARVDLDWTRYTTTAQARLFSDQLLERLEGTPGIETAAIASDFPLNSARPFRIPFLVSRAEGEAAPMVRADITSVGPGYFAAMGIPLLAGRVFTAADRDTVSAPAIVGQRFAKTYWPGHDPVGQRVSADSGATWHTVVGVVADVHQNSLSGELTDEVYLPFASSPSTTLRVLIRTEGGLGVGRAPVAGRRQGARRQAVDGRLPYPVLLAALDHPPDILFADPLAVPRGRVDVVDPEIDRPVDDLFGFGFPPGHLQRRPPAQTQDAHPVSGAPEVVHGHRLLRPRVVGHGVLRRARRHREQYVV